MARSDLVAAGGLPAGPPGYRAPFDPVYADGTLVVDEGRPRRHEVAAATQVVWWRRLRSGTAVGVPGAAPGRGGGRGGRRRRAVHRLRGRARDQLRTPAAATSDPRRSAPEEPPTADRAAAHGLGLALELGRDLLDLGRLRGVALGLDVEGGRRAARPGRR